MRVLVIEDNPDIKEILGYILQDDGHEVVSCMDGASLSFLKDIQPDVILMDDMLPGIRGSELCRGLKTNEETKDIPVILISAMPNLSAIARDCSADFYIEKPFDVDDLVKVIQRFIQ